MIDSQGTHHTTPLLALVSSILSFPPQATANEFDQLRANLSGYCPLSQFALLGYGGSGLKWVYEFGLPPSLREQVKADPERMMEALLHLKEDAGWCLLPVENGAITWLLAKTEPAEQPTLHLLLECLAHRLSESQAGAHLGEEASPFINHQPDWQQKVESLARIMRLANTLPPQALYAQLDAAARFILGVQDFILLHLEERGVDLVYPERCEHSDAELMALCHRNHPVEAERQGLFWSSHPLRLQRNYFAHLMLSSRAPPGADERLLVDFLKGQLTMVMELQRIRDQLVDYNSEETLNQRLHQLRQANLRLQKQLKRHQELERKLQFDALHDPLTRLPNRACLMTRLEQSMKHFHRYKSPGFTLIFIDIDHFKAVNDRLGHNVGDLLLKEFALRLGTCIRQNDMVARLGGDEFVIYLDNSMDEANINPVLNRLVERHSTPFHILGNELPISMSIGVAMVTEQTSDISQLLHQADLAMYQAKRNGRNRIVVYSEECSSQAWLSPEYELKQALAERRIIPYFQPLIRLKDSRLVGLEVMARWLTPEGALKDAFDFIPLAEQCGLILELDRHILRHTCQQLSNWLGQIGSSQFKVALNLSGKHLANHELVEQLLTIVQESGLSPRYLVFEFNERELSRQDGNTLTILHELRARGIQISLDDFGTGFSSLNALFHYPVDYIKVDDSFTHRMLQSPKDLAMIRAMRDISQDLGFHLVVEGIENQAEYQKLIELGCELGQGRFIAPPMQGIDIPPLLGRPIPVKR
ncbi:putative bifunctional diguanylate cyclase/phosphodiesterase [Aeromonas schubertii]